MLELNNISYKVIENNQEKIILDNISCIFSDGEITAITGHNGSGKSTLTKIIMGIIKPSSGSIIFNGVDITNMSITQRAQLGISYAFQQPIVFKGITIKDLIDIATKKENSLSDACEYLAKVGLCAKEYISRPFDKTLSGGEQKRVELALSLAKGGDCVIFDEPEAGIDLWSFTKLIDIFDKSKINIIVSHQERILNKSDKILLLEQGRIKSFGKSKEILKNLGNFVCYKMQGDKDGVR